MYDRPGEHSHEKGFFVNSDCDLSTICVEHTIIDKVNCVSSLDGTNNNSFICMTIG